MKTKHTKAIEESTSNGLTKALQRTPIWRWNPKQAR